MRLVKDNTVQTPPAPDSPPRSSSSTDPGTLKLHDSGPSYVQSVHWEAILTKIRGLQEDLIPDWKAPHGSELFYGPRQHATRDEILAAMPLRPVVDRLLALHFDSHIITPCQCFRPPSTVCDVDYHVQIWFIATSFSER
jgi:hypothetical protein